MAELPKIVVVTTTCYPDRQDRRFLLALETIQEAARRQIPMIIIDASPSPAIRDEMRSYGTVHEHSYADVRLQQSQGRKGAALREAVAAVTDNTALVCFQEPEKVDMIQHWETVVQHMVDTAADICIPTRQDASFQRTYPREQYHSEKFGNLYLDRLAQEAGGFGKEPAFDWLFGPLAWRVQHSSCWTDYTVGDLWDAQLCPLVMALRQHQAKIVSCEVNYLHPLPMKEDEEENPKFIEKRLLQLNHIFDRVGSLLKGS